mgnify:CR=1 FL=1
MTKGTPIVQQNDRLRKDPPTSPPTDTAKQNFSAQQYGNAKGHICLGNIHKQGDVTEGIGLHTPDGEHQLSLDIDGPRKGWTVCTGPGNFNVECGSANEEAEDSLILNAKNGNIMITATNGKIRLQGTDIELVAIGEGGSKGHIKCSATETFMIHETKKVLIDAKVMYKISTTGIGQVTANSVLKIYGSVIRGVTDACAVKDAKTGGQRFQSEQTQDQT